MKTCIIRNEKKFEVISLNDNENYPPNFVFNNKDDSSSFQLAENDIRVVWLNGYYPGYKLTFFFNGVEIKSIQNPNIQCVCDYLNKFANLGKEELEKLYTNAQKNIKTNLEQELEDLQKQRKLLQDELSKMKQIKQKKDEILKLIDELKL